MAVANWAVFSARFLVGGQNRCNYRSDRGLLLQNIAKTLPRALICNNALDYARWFARNGPRGGPYMLTLLSPSTF